MENSGETIMSALITLQPRHFSDLTTSLASDLRLQHRRLSFLLLSPIHFSLTLAHLHSLSLAQKALLLARLLLRSLTKLLPFSGAHHHHLRLRDFDAALLLMTMCEVYNHDPSNPSTGFDWRARIADYLLARTLSPATLGGSSWGVVAHYVDTAVKCRRLVGAVSGGKVGREVGAAVAAVVALPTVECTGEGRECAVCREEVEVGRDVCELPCGHGFHWGCVVRWLGRRNTCPCCRHELPTDDVFGEIERVWRVTARLGGRGEGGGDV